MGTTDAPTTVVEIPQAIIDYVKNGQCILFLGAMASAAEPPPGSPFKYPSKPPGGGALSKMLAEMCGYSEEDKTNLQRVALFFQSQAGKSRKDLVDAIVAQVAAPQVEPSDALRMLAALPFRFIITTNYDKLFEEALQGARTSDGLKKRPRISIYDPLKMGPPESVPLDPKEEEPVLLKLHGDIHKLESIVITEEDYITFIQRMSVSYLHPIHEKIRSRMMEWPVLFIGYSLKDYNLRLLFKTLRWHVDAANFPLSFSVDPYPDNLIVSVWENGPQPMVNFIEADLWDFVPALYKACLGHDYQQGGAKP